MSLPCIAGMQLMVHTLGGKVHTSDLGGEYGQMRIRTTQASQLYSYEPDPSQLVWMSHGDSAEQLPPEFSVVATSEQVQHLQKPQSPYSFGIKSIWTLRF